ncbi:Cysteine desulfurase [Streptomyces aurantiogriseus]
MTQLPGLLDTEALRKDFPILDRVIHDGRKLVYLDNAATSQTPRQVLDVLSEYYEQHNANVHRGVHVLAEEATALYEGARDKVAEFINAPSRDEVIFTKNASESLNLVANMLGWADEPYRVDSETEIVITEMEHHSNIVPWQLLAQRTGWNAELNVVALPDRTKAAVSTCRYVDEIITEKTKIVSFVLVSSILGTINPVEAVVRRAQEVGALVVRRRLAGRCRRCPSSNGRDSWPTARTAARRRAWGRTRPWSARPPGRARRTYAATNCRSAGATRTGPRRTATRSSARATTPWASRSGRERRRRSAPTMSPDRTSSGPHEQLTFCQQAGR